MHRIYGDTSIGFRKILNIALLTRGKYEDFARLNKEVSNKPLNSAEIQSLMSQIGLRFIFAINLKVDGPLLINRSLVIRSIASFEYRKGHEFLMPIKSKKKSKDLQRLLRQLNKFYFESTPFSELPESGWRQIKEQIIVTKKRLGVSNREISKLLKFLSVIRTRQSWRDQRVVVDMMYIDNELAACHIGLLKESYYLYWIPAYNPIYTKYSPGLQLLGYILSNHAVENGDVIDFGAGDESYKALFATHCLQSVSGILCF